MGKRVLVCEDDSAIRLLLDKLLTRRGLCVDSVPTGADALARLRREPYDLVLLDLLTPVLSGYVFRTSRGARASMQGSL